MARRKRRRHARENPLEDSTKVIIAVGVTAAVVGVGYYLYKRNQSATAGAQQFAPQLPGTDATRGQPPPGANAGGSSSTDAQQKQQQQLQSFKLGDAAKGANNANTTDEPAPAPNATTTMAMGYRQTQNTVYYPPNGVHAPRTARNGGGGGGLLDQDGNTVGS